MKFNGEQLLFEYLFDAMCIFGSVEPETESTFPFLYIIIFQKWESSSPLIEFRTKPPSCALGGDKHTPSQTFLYESQWRTKLFKYCFFHAMRIFGSIEPQTESIFLFL